MIYVNLYLWNHIKYRSYSEAEKDGNIDLVCRYIEKGSEEYKRLMLALEVVLNTTNSEVTFSIKEVSYATDEMNG